MARKFQKVDFVKDEFKEEIAKEEKEKSNLASAQIDLTKKYELPKFIIKLKNGNEWTNIGSLGNFVCITGQAKARKSFARFFFEAAAILNRLYIDRFYINLPVGKQDVIYIDTEQGKSSVSYAAQRICKMANKYNPSNYKVFALREYTYLERAEMIEDIIKNNLELGILFLDGVADLAASNNDEVEGKRVAQLLMTWTSKYNICIVTVIHQPRSHSGATGHLGSEVEKKAESIIATKKDGNYSIIESKLIRHSADFTPFPFLINDDNIPELIEANEQQEIESIYKESNEETPF